LISRRDLSRGASGDLSREWQSFDKRFHDALSASTDVARRLLLNLFVVLLKTAGWRKNYLHTNLRKGNHLKYIKLERTLYYWPYNILIKAHYLTRESKKYIVRFYKTQLLKIKYVILCTIRMKVNFETFFFMILKNINFHTFFL